MRNPALTNKYSDSKEKATNRLVSTHLFLVVTKFKYKLAIAGGTNENITMSGIPPMDGSPESSKSS